jgi:hypothetical protein
LEKIMEASRLIESLAAIRTQLEPEERLSDMDLIRRAVQAQEARALGIEQPPILNADQRKLFAENIELVTGFLESEDGADAVELLVSAWKTYVENCEIPTAEDADDD